MAKKKAEKPAAAEFTVRLNERQLRLMQRALENWARLRMGQTWDLADDLAFQHYEYKNDDQEFNQRLLRRDATRELLDLAMRAASGGNYMDHFNKTDDVMVALDMYFTIRNFFWHQKPIEERDTWTTDADPLYLWGPEPKMKIEKGE